LPRKYCAGVTANLHWLCFQLLNGIPVAAVAVVCIALNYWGKHKRIMVIRGI